MNKCMTLKIRSSFMRCPKILKTLLNGTGDGKEFMDVRMGFLKGYIPPKINNKKQK